jgi:hypothetical protein
MSKVHEILGMWQGSQNLCPTDKELRSESKQMTAEGYISDCEEIIIHPGHTFHTMV